jgi:hypothetical protein
VHMMHVKYQDTTLEEKHNALGLKSLYAHNC